MNLTETDGTPSLLATSARSPSDVSIECAHIYAHQTFGAEQATSVSLYRAHRNALRAEGVRVSSVILLDDLHSPSYQTGKAELKACLDLLGERIDSIILESTLLCAAKRFITTIPKKQLFYEPFRRASKRVLFVDTPDGAVALGSITNRPFEPTCALLIATWHLARLGRIMVPNLAPAARTLSILHERYQGVERKALALVAASAFRAETKNISHVFYT
jgi:hypothetical protein